MKTTLLKAEMEAMWEEVGYTWLELHTEYQLLPAGFRPDPAEVGPSFRREVVLDGWYLVSVDPRTGDDDVTYAVLPDTESARQEIFRLAAAYPKIGRIQLWIGDDCVFAARR